MKTAKSPRPSLFIPKVIALGEGNPDGSELLPVQGALPIPAAHTMVLGRDPEELAGRLLGWLVDSALRSHRDQFTVFVDLAGGMGPLVRSVCRQARGREPFVFNPSDPAHSVRLNPFEGIKDSETAMEFAHLLNAVTPPGDKDSPYWEQGATPLLAAAPLILRSQPGGKCCGGALHNLFTAGAKKAAELSSHLPEELRQNDHVNQFFTTALEAANGNSNAQTIWGTATYKFRAFDVSSAITVTNTSDLDLEVFTRQHNVLYLGLSSSDVTVLGPVVALTLHALLRSIRSPKAGPAFPVNLFIHGADRVVLPGLSQWLSLKHVSAVLTCFSLASFRTTQGGQAQSSIDAIENFMVVPEATEECGHFVSRLCGITTVNEVTTSDGATPTSVAPQARPVLTSFEIGSASRHPRLGPLLTAKLRGMRAFQFYSHPWHTGRGHRALLATTEATALPRRQARPSDPPHQAQFQLPGSNFTNTANLSDADIQARIGRVRDQLEHDLAPNLAQQWWSSFESANRNRPSIVLRVCEELLNRHATIEEFYHAWFDSRVDNIQAVLHYLDYLRLRREHEERVRQENPPPEEEQQEEVTDELLEEWLASLDDDQDQEKDQDKEKDKASAQLNFVRCQKCRSLIQPRRACPHCTPPKRRRK